MFYGRFYFQQQFSAKMMERLWAPWRSQYVEKHSDRVGQSCFLCEIVDERTTDCELVVFRTELHIVLLNKFPYNAGHILIATKRHVPFFTDLSKDELIDYAKVLQLSHSVLNAALHPHGLNSGVNIGEAAGAGVPSHIHSHVVPRWRGDSNFMSTVGDTRVISSSLTDMSQILREHFAKLA